MQVRSIERYRAWLEHEGTATVLIYAGLIVVLLPAFHFVLAMQPGRPYDNMALRWIGAAISAAVAVVILGFPRLRKYCGILQFFNVFPTFVLVLMLVAQSGNNVFYVASGLLVIVGMQQAFFRVRELALAMSLGILFQIWYTWHIGLWSNPLNNIVILIYASGCLIAFLPAYVNIRTREREMQHRFEAETARTEVARQLSRETVITRIVEYIRSTFDLQAVLDSVAEALGPQVGADRIHVAIWSEPGDEMIIKSEWRADPLSVPTLLHQRLKGVRWGRFYRRLLAGQTLHVPDVEHAELGHSQREFFLLGGTKEFATVPVLAQNRRRLLGFIGMSSTSNKNTFNKAQIEFLEAISGQVAIAIQQSRVYEQLQEELDYRRRQEARLSDLANRDPLTGIFNRRYFAEEVSRALERTTAEGHRGAVFFLDLDNFKVVNDTLGHDAGDRVLTAIPRVIRTALRESDLLARLGGDEFAVLLSDVPQTETINVAEKIRKCIAGYTFRESGRAFDLGVSIGVALLEPQLTAQELIARADEACYRAKGEGRNAIALWDRAAYA